MKTASKILELLDMQSFTRCCSTINPGSVLSHITTELKEKSKPLGYSTPPVTIWPWGKKKPTLHHLATRLRSLLVEKFLQYSGRSQCTLPEQPRRHSEEQGGIKHPSYSPTPLLGPSRAKLALGSDLPYAESSADVSIPSLEASLACRL